MRFLLKNLYNDSLIKNAVYLMSTNLLNMVLGFFFWVITARYYTPVEVGTVSALISAMFLISMISGFGFPIAFLYYLPREPKKASRIINSCLTAAVFGSFIFSFIFIAGINIWAPPLKPSLTNTGPVILFAVVTAATVISGLLSGTFVAGRRSIFHTAKESVFGIIKILPLTLFIGLGAMGIFFSWGIGVMVAVLFGFIFVSKTWKGYLPVPALDLVIKNMAGYSAGNYLAGIFYSLPHLALPIMVANIISIESTAFFYIAMTVAGLLYGVSEAISISLLVESSHSGDIRDKVRKSIRFNAFLLIPGVLMFILFGKTILYIFNPEYAQNASLCLIILAVASLPVSVNVIFTSVRNAQKRVSSVVKINSAVAVITLILAVPLIRSMGIEGAAIAYLIANTIGALVVMYKMKNRVEFLSKLFARPRFDRSEGE